MHAFAASLIRAAAVLLMAAGMATASSCSSLKVECNVYGVVEEMLGHPQATISGADGHRKTASEHADHDDLAYCFCKFQNGTKVLLAADPMHFFSDGSALRSGETLVMTIADAECERDDVSLEGNFLGPGRRRAVKQADISEQNNLVLQLKKKHFNQRNRRDVGASVFIVASAERPAKNQGDDVGLVDRDGVTDDGPRNWLIIRMQYTDGDISYCDEDCANGIMTDYAQSVNNFYKDTSYNRISFPASSGNVVTVNINRRVSQLRNDNCDFDEMGFEADAAARALGLDATNPDRYTHKIYVMPIDDIGCQFSGVAYTSAIGCDMGAGSDSCKAWVRHPAASVLAHELGHNLGVVHASTADADDNSVACTYCDHSGIMGNGPMVGFIASHRYELDWLDGPNDILNHPADCSVDPVVTIAPLDRKPSSGYGYSAVRVERKLGGHYWLSFRQNARGFDQNLGSAYANKISVHQLRPGRSTALLTTLDVGETFQGTSLVTGSKFTVQLQGYDSKGSALVLIDFGCNGATITTVATTLPATWEGRECTDQSPTGWFDSNSGDELTCATLKAWGLCKEDVYDGEILDTCPFTCGVCDPNSLPTPTLPAPTPAPVTPPPLPPAPLEPCVCQAEWDYEGVAYSGCALTLVDSRPWCYTTAECATSSPSKSFPGQHWNYCERAPTAAPTAAPTGVPTAAPTSKATTIVTTVTTITTTTRTVTTATTLTTTTQTTITVTTVTTTAKTTPPPVTMPPSTAPPTVSGSCGHGSLPVRMKRGSCRHSKNQKVDKFADISTEAKCKLAAAELGLSTSSFKKLKQKKQHPGCTIINDKLVWNVHKGKATYSKKKQSLCCTPVDTSKGPTGSAGTNVGMAQGNSASQGSIATQFEGENDAEAGADAPSVAGTAVAGVAAVIIVLASVGLLVRHRANLAGGTANAGADLSTEAAASRRASTIVEATVIEETDEFASARFSVDDTAHNLRVESVKRDNPAYTASIYIDNTEDFSVGI